MSVLMYMCAFVVVDVASSVITCSDPGPLSMKVGEEHSLESTCILPEECRWGATGVTSTPPLPSYSEPGVPIVGRTVIDFGLSNVTVRYTFRGFDNMLGGKDSLIEHFLWTVSCSANNSNITDAHVMNFTVQMGRSDDGMFALEPPAEIPVDCLVEGSETLVPMIFTAPDASASYRALIGGWKEGDELPWVFSRPAEVMQFTEWSTHEWDAGSQPILKGIEAEPDGRSLKVLFKPNGGASYGESWKVCMYPGDGFNWFPKICTGQFVVRSGPEECDATPTTISGGTLSFPSLASLVFGFACFHIVRL